MPMLLRDCFKCRFFRTISYVHPESVAATKEGVFPGWYLRCQRNIKLDDGTIKPVDGFLSNARSTFRHSLYKAHYSNMRLWDHKDSQHVCSTKWLAGTFQ
ncbi:MAG TPA: hypothetical protein GXX39_02305 [Syntrophothermus lipocalidus]|nr:hypothetical protein [Syntrophothermus lipocalidus]